MKKPQALPCPNCGERVYGRAAACPTCKQPLKAVLDPKSGKIIRYTRAPRFRG